MKYFLLSKIVKKINNIAFKNF